MKIFDLRKAALESEEGETVLGARQTGSHACYMIYGRLAPGEEGRLVRPGAGHEEIVLSAKGGLSVSGYFTGMLPEGSALHLSGDQECRLENPGETDAVYIIAGGHAEGGHH